MEFIINKKNLEKLGKTCECTINKTHDFICPCKEFKETGNCICGIFRKTIKNEGKR